ncbi:GTP-binding protein gtr1 [Pneumocystis murina B123]|uniref:GTP-binding protein n=1 Tax=Pneumocystis murina (strain B123) TaxID=1069680 RepID=M7P8Y1_PNEMU|nr:GTP-binding protein gtr1 [Pneumocystis murina B123]EMR10280.1 GTP-binding protein gtr1 [Pneumocystis murina B123]
MKKKVLLMGKSGSGKSSMRSIIFSNYIAKDTRRLGATIDVEHSHVHFLGNLVLNLWDCGGQDAFMENYLSAQRDHIFRNVEVLIYVFDVESREFDVDLHTYESCLEAIRENSPKAQVFCLIHKMDLVQEEMRDYVYQERSKILYQRSENLETVILATSIWDETLYKAWSCIVYTLVPNIPTLEKHLKQFALHVEADEVVLFERTTFLVISHTSRPEFNHPDLHRFEKISNIVKQFKLSCSKMQSQFILFELRTCPFSAFIAPYACDTYILVILSDPLVQSAALLMNIEIAKNSFERIDVPDKNHVKTVSSG